MRKRGYKRKSIRSQEFREDRLRNLQSHSLRSKKISILLYCCLYQNSEESEYSFWNLQDTVSCPVVCLSAVTV